MTTIQEVCAPLFIYFNVAIPLSIFETYCFVNFQHRQNDETKVSSVLVDETSDSSIIRVSSQGFHPQNVNITKVSLLKTSC